MIIAYTLSTVWVLKIYENVKTLSLCPEWVYIFMCPNEEGEVLDGIIGYTLGYATKKIKSLKLADFWKQCFISHFMPFEG